MKKILALVLALAVMLPLAASAAPYNPGNSGADYALTASPNLETYNVVTGKGTAYQEEGPSWHKDKYWTGVEWASGWYEIGGKVYYFDPATKNMVRNKWIGSDKGGWYYFGANGTLAKNTWLGDYYVGKDGKWIPNYGTKGTEGMKHDSYGYWYDNGDGTFVKNAWKKITTNYGDVQPGWYYFNNKGYMLRNTWVGDYYVTETGRMAANESKVIDGDTYYFDADGDVYKIVDADGNVYENTLVSVNISPTQENSTRVWTISGQKTGWIKLNGLWYFFNSTGDMLTNQWVDGYYVGADGSMITTKNNPNGFTYIPYSGGVVGVKELGCFIDGNGKRVSKKWVKSGDDWYYINENSKLAANTWVGDYYLGADGRMLVNTWVGDWYVGPDGKCVYQ